MKKNSFLTLTLAICLSASTHAEDVKLQHISLPNDNPETNLTHFAFGACWQPNRAQGHWEQIPKNNPQFWLWLGDNIYANTNNPAVMKKKYQQPLLILAKQ